MSPAVAMTVPQPKSLNIFGRPLSIFGVPVERDTIFSNHKGVYKNRIEKRQRKLIIKTAFIKFFLHADERILCLTTGFSPVSVKEQVLTGPSFLFFKRAIFAFTDKRILHVPASFNRGSRCAITQILYDDCAALDIRGRSLEIRYKNGTEESFPYIGRKEKRKIAALLDKVKLTPAKTDGLHRRVFLCPSCTNPVENKAARCPACQLAFKTRRGAIWRTIFVPGGGYFYNHYGALGFVLGLAEIALISYLVYSVMTLKSGIAVNMGVPAVVLCALLCEKCLTAYHTAQLSRDLMIPETKDYAMRKV